MSKSLAKILAALALAGAAGAPARAQTPAAVIDLATAQRMARANSPQFQAAAAALGVAREDHRLARDAMLPSVTYNNGYLYTQGGTGVITPRYIANNAVHEYISQGQVHEDLFAGGAHLAGLSRARAGVALARAQLEIAARGLAATVTGAYYALLAAQSKAGAAAQAVAEAQRFVRLSEQLQQGGEVAQADVIKARLQLGAEQRAQQEAALALEQSRLNLAVLLFPRFDENFTVRDDLAAAPPLPGFDRIRALAAANPDVGAAEAALRQARAEVSLARAGFLPTLSLDYWYGIDADHFAVNDPIGPGRLRDIPNLGYSAQATLAIPIWNWGATGSKVHQAQLRRQVAQAQLTFTQRALLANLHSLYAEASTARAELASLEQSATLAQESLRLTNLRYQGGLATALEVVDAQNALIQARNALADGQARYHAALAQLQTLTGSW